MVSTVWYWYLHHTKSIPHCSQCKHGIQTEQRQKMRMFSFLQKIGKFKTKIIFSTKFQLTRTKELSSVLHKLRHVTPRCNFKDEFCAFISIHCRLTLKVNGNYRWISLYILRLFSKLVPTIFPTQYIQKYKRPLALI